MGDNRNVEVDHLRQTLGRAANALEAACRLLDTAFRSRRWRAEWTMPETAAECRRESSGWPTIEEAEEEAARRGKPWSVWYTADGAPMVTIAD